MAEPKRFNIDDSEVKRCRLRLVEIGVEQRAIHERYPGLQLEDYSDKDLAKTVALTTEIATIRGIQQGHALRCAAELQVLLDKRARQ